MKKINGDHYNASSMSRMTGQLLAIYKIYCNYNCVERTTILNELKISLGKDRSNARLRRMTAFFFFEINKDAKGGFIEERRKITKDDPIPQCQFSLEGLALCQFPRRGILYFSYLLDQ